MHRLWNLGIVILVSMAISLPGCSGNRQSSNGESKGPVVQDLDIVTTDPVVEPGNGEDSKSSDRDE